MADTVNRLAEEKSPYLLQHAHNPVEWYPWGDEAFTTAKERDIPIFLSIGYATCHWCHVMESESFEDREIADLMNRTFVNVKVDREERPDVDHLYMTVCQLLTGSGGWPLTLILTPDRRPLFAATYLPKMSGHGRVGMLDLVPRVAELWEQRRHEVEASADAFAQRLRAVSDMGVARDLDPATLDTAADNLRQRFDSLAGGFGGAPKFPIAHNITFLLRRWRRTGDRRALDMTLTTLDHMRRGGVYDQIGFGFHRYSTDARWLVPHFEKMLPDQALLSLAYLEAYEATGEHRFADVVDEILTYVRRDLTSDDGGFFCAEDADSEGEEGRFYVWSMEEIERALDGRELRVARAAWSLAAGGNYREELTGRPSGLNIVHRLGPDAEQVARDLGFTVAQTSEALERARRRLLELRAQRTRPAVDDKVLTDWNGLAIAAFARAGAILDQPRFVESARRAAVFVLDVLTDDRDELLHRWRDGHAAVPGFLDDFAFLTYGLLELHQATQQPVWLEHVIRLTEQSLELFGADDGGLFIARPGAEDLIARPRESFDGALPSGVSIMVDNLLRLGRLTGRTDFADRAAALIRSVAEFVEQDPAAHTALLGAIETQHAPTFEIVFAGDPEDDRVRRFQQIAREAYIPGSTVLLIPDGPAGDPARALAPFTGSFPDQHGRPTAYVCRGFQCEAPTHDPHRLRTLLIDDS